MGAKKGYSREEILRFLQEFARDAGRPPKRNEPGFERVVEAAKREFGSWNYALKIAGLQTYKEWRKKRTFGAKIVALLKGNPLTYKEIENELAKDSVKSFSESPTRLATALKQCSDIKSIGPRKGKIYFLEGQEVLAQTRLDAVFSKVADDEEMLFSLLRKPMSMKEILNYFPGRKARCEVLLRELISAKLIYPAEFVKHSRAHTKYNTSFLFGNLAGKRYYCRFDCAAEMFEFILDNIPMKNFDDGNFMSSFLYRLKSTLPKEIFEDIKRRFAFQSKPDLESRRKTLDYFLR